MPNTLKAGLTVAAHALVVLVIAAALKHGIVVPDSFATAAQDFLVSAAVAGYVWLGHWLGQRKGTGLLAVAARGLAFLMGLGTTPVQLSTRRYVADGRPKPPIVARARRP